MCGGILCCDHSQGASVNSSVGVSVIQVTATDADAGSNGEISYLLSGSDRFIIDSVTGEITVARPLDYETVIEPYTLTVIARDNGMMFTLC